MTYNASPVVADYRQRAPRYGQRVRTYRDPALSMAMLRNLHLSSPVRAVDLACGQGDASLHLRAAGLQVVYLDLSRAMLTQGIAREVVDPRRAVVADISSRDLPFRPATFDIAMLRYATHDVRDKAGLISSVRRILRPGGCLQIVDMSTASPALLDFYNELHGLKTREDGTRRCWIVGVDAYRDLLDSGDFEVISLDWYTSRVSSRDWLAEGQISPRRHREMLDLVAARAREPGIADAFELKLGRASFTVSFPVLIITGRKRAGQGSRRKGP